MIFCQGTFNNFTCLELFIFYFAWWSKSAWGDSIPSVSNVSRSPSNVVTPSLIANAHRNLSWMPLDQNIIKINMDGSFNSSSSVNGIGELLRDHHGSFFIQFAKHVDADSANHIEVLAIREMMHVAAASR